MYRLTKTQLLKDLYIAFYGARQHKANAPYVLFYEKNLKENLSSLCESLWNNTYKPKPSRCFIVNYPKKREVFAADFSDRIVHHLYFNYTHKLFESTFIFDSYSCIEGKGTHFGISRLKHHILKESQNYNNPCYVIKYDIRGYFMHINRNILNNIAIRTIEKMENHFFEGTKWEDTIDIDFVKWLTTVIIMINPVENCIRIGKEDDWIGLDKNKSLFNSDEGCGLPIGNLTSQLFSNVYLNVFDQYIKRNLKIEHYGRYVDDAYVVSCNKEELLSSIQKVKSFLKNELSLDLHMGKLNIYDVKKGVEFLGAYILPYRTYISNQSLKRMKSKMSQIDFSNKEKVLRTTNSYLGTLKHYSSYNIRKALFFKKDFLSIANFDINIQKMCKNE